MSFDCHALAIVNTAAGVLGGPGFANRAYRLGREAEGGGHEEDTVNAAYGLRDLLGLVVIRLRWVGEMGSDENIAYLFEFWPHVGVPKGPG
jgi:hypothetical protein